MTDYDYGNARLRAMKARLLSVDQLMMLTENRSIDLFITQLTQTPYQPAVEIALIRSVGFERVNTLLRHHLIEIAAKVRRFYGGVAQQLLVLVLSHYDIHNIKTILRGLSQYVPANQITNALLPLGELPPTLLNQLVHVEQVTAVVDMLASMQYAIARPLVDLRSSHPHPTLAEMELSLEQWYFNATNAAMARLHQQETLLALALKIEADVINLPIVLRFVHSPVAHQQLLEHMQLTDISQLMVQAGHLSHPVLTHAAQASTLHDAIQHFQATPYAAALAEGLNHYRKTQHLSEFERHLRHYRTQALAHYIARDPLGIGVPIGYWALKENEIRNLRAIAWGIQFGHTPSDIQRELAVVA